MADLTLDPRHSATAAGACRAGTATTRSRPVDPTYDYRRAAWDAVHFPRLLDRFWQNLRRAVGWNVQYAGCVEPQRRLAPHAHFAIRGTIPRAMLRQVAAATYHQVWWPPVDQPRLHRRPAARSGTPTPTAGSTRTPAQPLPTWAEALDELDADPDAEPAHVVRFGPQVDAEGVLAGTSDADRTIGYITKYVTKSVADCHTATSDRQRDHLDRLWTRTARHAVLRPVRRTGCSTASNPRRPTPGCGPAAARARSTSAPPSASAAAASSSPATGPARPSPTTAPTRRAWVRKALLGVTPRPARRDGEPGQPAPYAWERPAPDDPDVPPARRIGSYSRDLGPPAAGVHSLDDAIAVPGSGRVVTRARLRIPLTDKENRCRWTAPSPSPRPPSSSGPSECFACRLVAERRIEVVPVGPPGSTRGPHPDSKVSPSTTARRRPVEAVDVRWRGGRAA